MENPFEGPELTTVTRKVRITIEATMQFSQDRYSTVINDDGDEIQLTEVQMSKLSAKDMLQYDKNAMKAGEFDIHEFIDYGDVDLDDDVTIELVEDDA